MLLSIMSLGCPGWPTFSAYERYSSVVASGVARCNEHSKLLPLWHYTVSLPSISWHRVPQRCSLKALQRSFSCFRCCRIYNPQSVGKVHMLTSLTHSATYLHMLAGKGWSFSKLAPHGQEKVGSFNNHGMCGREGGGFQNKIRAMSWEVTRSDWILKNERERRMAGRPASFTN